MKLHAYTIRDTKADTWGIPFFVKNDASAKRAFYNLVNDPQSTVNRNPEDYLLYKVGTWDDEGAIIEPSIPVQIATAIELVDHGTPVKLEVAK